MKKRRNCEKCVAFYNIRNFSGYKCGLGYEMAEDIENGRGGMKVVTRPYDDLCEEVEQPVTVEEFIAVAASRGIEWRPESVRSISDGRNSLW